MADTVQRIACTTAGRAAVDVVALAYEARSAPGTVAITSAITAAHDRARAFRGLIECGESHMA
jgi:hypothetical protein